MFRLAYVYVYTYIYRKCLEVAHDLNNYAILIILSNSLNSFNYGQATGIACIYTRKPPLRPQIYSRFPNTLKRDIGWRVEGNLQDVSTEFLGNHYIPTSVKLYIQGNRQDEDEDDEEDDDDDDDDDDGVVTFNAQVAKLCVAR